MKNKVLLFLKTIHMEIPLLKVYFKLLGLKKGLYIGFKQNKIYTTSKYKETIIISMNNIYYLIDIINYFDHYYNVVFPSVDVTFKNSVVVDFSLPRYHTLKTSNLTFLFSSFPESDEITQLYVNKMTAKKGDIIIDFGSFCGTTVYTFSKLVGDEGKVYAFEPDEANYKCLISNIEKHKLTNVVPLKKAIWSKTTQLEFQAEGNMGSAVKGASSRENHTVKIDAISLDDLIKEYDIPKIDFIKMDIEGSEEEVIKSIKYTLKKYQTPIIIEVHKNALGQMTSVSIEKNLIEIDFNYEYIRQLDLKLPLLFACPK